MIATIIRIARTNLNFSQEKLAENIGFSRHFISGIETGRTKKIGARTLVKLESALKLPEGFLLRLE